MCWFASSTACMWNTSCLETCPRSGLANWPSSWSARRKAFLAFGRFGSCCVACRQTNVGGFGIAMPKKWASTDVGSSSLVRHAMSRRWRLRRSPAPKKAWHNRRQCHGGRCKVMLARASMRRPTWQQLPGCDNKVQLAPLAHKPHGAYASWEIAPVLNTEPLGPKSQVARAKRWQLHKLVKTNHTFCTKAFLCTCNGARVGTHPVGVPGAAQHAPASAGHLTAKPNREWIRTTRESGLRPQTSDRRMSAVRKRSFNLSEHVTELPSMGLRCTEARSSPCANFVLINNLRLSPSRIQQDQAACTSLRRCIGVTASRSLVGMQVACLIMNCCTRLESVVSNMMSLSLLKPDLLMRWSTVLNSIMSCTVLPHMPGCLFLSIAGWQRRRTFAGEQWNLVGLCMSKYTGDGRTSMS